MRRIATYLLLATLAHVPAAALGADGPPPLPREFRAVWVATVGNIDWPSRRGLPTEDQKREAIAILDKVAALNLNAVVLQVRTAADALYDSKIEPWSVVLTGRQGVAPEPFYDPLAFWVEEAHRRGLQLHAWINPFRARPAGAPKEMAESHVARTHPDWVKPYGDLLWMDPGEPGARDQTLEVVADIARRYDVDGLHVDDYFYPYPVARPGGGNLEFPDDPSWDAYRKSGGTLARGDWRRENINRLIEGMYRRAHEVRPSVQVGISPFGLPRPGTVAGMKGFDQYEGLYADAETWLRRGWCDYWSPQLYWKIDAPGQPFRPLLDYWTSINDRNRHIWPGLSSSRVRAGERGYAPSEIFGQIAIIRETPGDDGNVLFSMKSLMRNNAGFSDGLKAGPYKTPAVVPTSPWLDREPPARPLVTFGSDGRRFSVRVRPGPSERPFLWAVWTRRGAEWTFAVYPAATERVDIGNAETVADEVAVSAVDRLGNESERVPVREMRPRPGR